MNQTTIAPNRPPVPIGLSKFRPTLRVFEQQIPEFWCLASYLILNFNIKDHIRWAEMEVTEEFTKTLAQHVYAYIYEDKAPPAGIEQTVLNVAEDLAAGRQVVLRAGDYISVQKFIREIRPTK